VSTFAEVFRFEIAYRFRQWTTWLYFAAMAAATWLLLIDLMIGEAAGTGTIHANAPATIAMVTVIATMLMLVAAAGLFGDAAARDVETRMHPLLYTMPISKSGYLGGRFLGAFTINALLLAVAAGGIVLVEMQRASQPELFGAMRPLAYIQPYFVFALPTIFAIGAIMFALAALTGRTLASYAAGAFLFFGSWLSGDSFDPFGLATLDKLTQYWTPFETNTRFVPFADALLWNRLTWMALGGVVLALTHVRFRFHDGGQRRRTRRAIPPPERAAAPRIAPEVRPTFNAATRLRQMAAVATRSLSEIFLTRATLAALTLLLAMIVKAGWQSAGVILDTPTWPMTSLVAREVLGDAGAVLVLLSILFAGELVWRERDTRSSAIVDTAPLPNWVLLTGKLGAMIAALAIVQAALMAAGIGLQAAEGYFELEPALYAKILFGIQLPQYVVWAALALFVHVVVNHKYAGHFVAVLCWALIRFGRSALGIEHNLLAWGADPGWSYSDISGFEPFFVPWLSFRLYWTAWALLLMIAATFFWPRGQDRSMRLPRRAVAALATAALGVVATGGWVFYNTNILNDYRTSDERQDARAAYERRYKRYEKLPQPLITHARLHVELDRRAVHVRGTYRLENQTGKPIDSVHVILNKEARPRYEVFPLPRPLQPGKAMQLRFHVVHEPRGFTNARAGGEIVGNGTYFGRTWMPMIGYQRELELADDLARKERGLPPRGRLASLDDQEALQQTSAIGDTRWLQLDTTIGTALDQTAVAPGTLRRTWTANGKRWFHYVTDAPIQNIYAIHSAAYAVTEDRWNGVAIQVLHHPRHTRNLDGILRATKATLDYHARHFGPYPHRELRIVEFPRHRGTYARAYPTALALSEGFGLMARPENGIDYPFLVTAHEVSHQWWGNQLRPARVEGAQVLTETLAHYTALMVLEQTYGREPVDRARELFQHRYLLGRRGHRASEVPLLRSNDHDYIHYNKGALVMYTLREAIGEERVNTALRRLFVKHRFGGPPFPTARDLYAELRAVTPEAQRGLLRDLFETITLWSLRAKSARSERLPNGTYRVTLTVSAEKIVADATGRDRPVPMDDRVDIGVFDASGAPLYLQPHRIRSGEQTIAVTVPRAPKSAGIDPRRKLIQRDLEQSLLLPLP